MQNTKTSIFYRLVNPLASRLAAIASVLLLSIGAMQSVQAQAVGVESSAQIPERHYIIGGNPVLEERYPWTVALAFVADRSLQQRQFCGGSVIEDRWVLTAAHCLFDRNGDLLSFSDFTVATNARSLLNPNAQEIVVSNAYIHPAYDHNANNPHSDLALLELATSSGVTPVALSLKASDVLVGLQGTVIGWGAIDYTNPSFPVFPDDQYSVDVPLVSLEVCNSPVSYANSILPNQLCAGFAEGGRDSCVGDSGGPLVVTYEGIVQQVGIVSFGFGCAEPNFYGVYTDVPYFINWINQYVFIGEPEFEPEFISNRDVSSINGTVTTPSDTGSASLLALLMLGGGLLLRRRS